jgi:hypothetical protein
MLVPTVTNSTSTSTNASMNMNVPVLEVAVLLVPPVALLPVAAAGDAVQCMQYIHTVIHTLASIAFPSASSADFSYKLQHKIHASITQRS